MACCGLARGGQTDVHPRVPVGAAGVQGRLKVGSMDSLPPRGATAVAQVQVRQMDKDQGLPGLGSDGKTSPECIVCKGVFLEVYAACPCSV